MYVYMVATAHWSPWGEILVSIRNISSPEISSCTYRPVNYRGYQGEGAWVSGRMPFMVMSTSLAAIRDSSHQGLLAGPRFSSPNAFLSE